VNASCEEVRELAPELALGVLAGDQRARALSHLARCDRCRGEVAALADAADAVLLVAPGREPPSGFESRVVAAMAPAPRPSRRRRWWLVAAAAAVAVALVAGVVVGATRGDGEREQLAAAELRDGGGDAIGEVFLYEGEPAWVFVHYEQVPPAAGYAMEVELDGGEVVRRPAPWLDEGEGSWGATVDVDPASVRAIRLTTDDGWRCEGRF
jgi:anti-sigma factor RsiW